MTAGTCPRCGDGPVELGAAGACRLCILEERDLMAERAAEFGEEELDRMLEAGLDAALDRGLETLGPDDELEVVDL